LDRSIGNLGLRVLQTPPRVPQANAICERFLGTLRRECLDFIIPSRSLTYDDCCKSGWRIIIAAVHTCPWVQVFPSRPCCYRCHSMAPDTGCPRMFVW
jgi:transposase InsO family protein